MFSAQLGMWYILCVSPRSGRIPRSLSSRARGGEDAGRQTPRCSATPIRTRPHTTTTTVGAYRQRHVSYTTSAPQPPQPPQPHNPTHHHQTRVAGVSPRVALNLISEVVQSHRVRVSFRGVLHSQWGGGNPTYRKPAPQASSVPPPRGNANASVKGDALALVKALRGFGMPESVLDKVQASLVPPKRDAGSAGEKALADC